MIRWQKAAAARDEADKQEVRAVCSADLTAPHVNCGLFRVTRQCAALATSQQQMAAAVREREAEV